MPTRREGNGPDARPARLSTPVLLDGNINEWGSTPFLSLDYVTFGLEQWSGSADLSGSAAFAWERETLYLAIQRRDDRHIQERSGEDLYRGDVVELWLDVDVSGDYLATDANQDDFQIGFSAGDFTGRRAEAYLFYPAPAGAERSRQVRVRAAPQPDGYTLEAAIPWEVLGVTPRAGLTLGYAVVFSDIDNPERDEAESQLTTTPAAPFRNPTAFANLTLAD
jgi:hypothetical protein